MQFLTVFRSVCSGLMCFLKFIGEKNEKNGEIICKDSFFFFLFDFSYGRFAPRRVGELKRGKGDNCQSEILACCEISLILERRGMSLEKGIRYMLLWIGLGRKE